MPAIDAIWIPLHGARPPARRTLDAAIWARFPAVFRAAAWSTLRLPRRSRLRQALLRRAVLQSMGAWVRGDFELALTRYTPDAVVAMEIRTGVTLDFEPSYRGREGVQAFIRIYQDAFGEQSYEPQWLVDLGENVLVMVLHHSLRGRVSGAEVEQVSAHRLHMQNGLVAREEIHAAPGHDLEPVLDAVGLDPGDLPGRLSG